ncbi:MULTISPECIES: DUF3263 domain-containing protein [unclassified Streptomyces]|uniref:DUF3263 domain-containing protein n=1 Tax=unclassified Streptomyces TaxID=2593676 RepID=UPI0001C1CA08|nr:MULTISPECIES: DUF3263 domain-containing protein [unclassified Streptomyces]AEN11557.1 conserved hypothetical protein [Streptomyces sp. SirexAA-E]MYR67422.1 DUF3263 domain-containing protein [Streptomyces sp. SID4939]MYS01357.1 DUF3263 domain-containing protein [Streptomyces sp. SID4940]MYT61920.1 DUF3263 domain-containing protein [Streptomyces sp. SID8357]MYT85290.1 DUF3263 domain-containing protein [Streptomyces sp. SID8360]
MTAAAPDPDAPDPDASAPDALDSGASDPGASAPDAALSDQERAVLAVERQSWPGPGAKERAIRERLGMSPVRYFQLLNALLDDRRALEEDPVTVNRLRRVREARRDRR